MVNRIMRPQRVTQISVIRRAFFKAKIAYKLVRMGCRFEKRLDPRVPVT